MVPAPLTTAPTMKVQAPTPSPMDTETKTTPAEEEKKEEEKAPEDKFFLQNLLESTTGGKQWPTTAGRSTAGRKGITTTARRNDELARAVHPARQPVLAKPDLDARREGRRHRQEGNPTRLRAFDGFYGTGLLHDGVPQPVHRPADPDQRQPYGWDIFQAYADVFLPNLGSQGTTLRMGKFATFLEYEVVQGISNPFITRSYLFEYNPFTHTGALAITPLNDDWTMQNGAVLGARQLVRPEHELVHLHRQPEVGRRRTARSWAQFGTMISNAQFNQPQNFNNYDVFNLQVDRKITDKLTYLLDASYLVHAERAERRHRRLVRVRELPASTTSPTS